MNQLRFTLGALLIGASLLPAQQNFTASKFDVDLGVGAGGFHRRPDPLQTKLTNHGLVAIRVTQNLWNHWSLEQSFTQSIGADLLLSRAAGFDFNRQDFNQRMRTFMFNPVYHLTESNARIRPFLTLGLGAVSYSPTRTAKDMALRLTPFPAANLDTSTRFGVNYGGGIKARLTNLVSFRFDIRGLTTGAPTFGLPESGPNGSFFIPSGGRAHSIQTTGGVMFTFGDKGSTGAAPASRIFRLDPIAANPPSPIRPNVPSLLTTKLTDSKNAKNIVWEWMVNGARQPNANGPEFRFDPAAPGTYTIVVTASDGATSASEKYTMVVEDAKPRTFKLSGIDANPPSPIFAGESTTLTANLQDSAPSGKVTYEWTVNGVKQEGANGPTFRFTPPGPGTYTITVTARDGSFTDTASYTLVVKEAPPLTITASADQNDVKAGTVVNLTARSQETEYSGPLTYSWRLSDGTANGGANATFNTSTVQFDPGAQFRSQNKTVTVTAQVTDRRGRTATSQPLSIRVTRDAQALRLDDIIYGKGSARVNNCGKRILIDELSAIVNSNPDVDVLLIGHRDEAEKAAAGLDRARTINAAAVISAGKGICGNCALERIKVDWVGADQSSEHRAGFCGTSSRNKSEERKADEIAADDAAAKNRRVEVWIVPKGMSLPAAAKNPRPAPAKEIRLKGCPK
ncbi:hypothetical protein F183_A52450 [Bryobacterales bacterium F-183]|nr:hypothetical protein F183_A52450 [Bryobacterales bacterium F-183]